MKIKLARMHLPGIILFVLVILAGGCEQKNSSSCEDDSYEPNNSTGNSYELSPVEENSSSITARISSKDDLDFYTITAMEGVHTGIPGTAQYFKMNFQLINPTGKDYDLYIYNDEGSLLDQSVTRGDEEEAVEATWEGTVGYDDSYTFGIEVRPYSGDWSCEVYTLTFTMSYSSNPW